MNKIDKLVESIEERFGKISDEELQMIAEAGETITKGAKILREIVIGALPLEKDETFLVRKSMIRWGGAFVNALGEALIHADSINQRRIKYVFGDYWDKYYKLGLEHKAEFKSD